LSPDVKIAVGKIEKRALEQDSVDNRDALGVALLTAGDVEKAVSVLEDAVGERPNNPELLSDLGAAFLAQGRLNRPEDYPRALAAIERAVRTGNASAEARFNRALALETLHLDAAAAQAWRDYLQSGESAPEWREEVWQHLKALTDRGTPVARDRAHIELLEAIRGNDRAGIAGIATAYPSVVRRQIQDSIERWADACLSTERHCSSASLRDATGLAGVLAATVADKYETDWTVSLSAAAAVTHGRALARAVQLFRKGVDLNEAFKFEEAAPYFQAAGREVGARTPLAIAAQLQLASIKYHARDYAAARPELEAVIRTTTVRGYTRLQARAELVVGLILVNEGSYSAGLDRLSRSATAFERARDIDGLVNARISAGQTLNIIGRNADAGWRTPT